MEECTVESAASGEKTTEEAKGGDEGKKMKVMVAVDESEGSMHALCWALDHLFTSTGGEVPDKTQALGRLILLHAQLPPYHLVHPVPVGPAVYATSSAMESVRKAREENSICILERASKICMERLIKAETVIIDGDPKDVICGATEEMNIDLLIMGSRGLGKIKRAILGSVSDHCAHHAKCPILIVKPPKVQP
ncbi:Universal stress protein A [Cocos nucifera]|uniref:Universal stress protein A n=1 Tax=Cocos nucifera TaxID=13894 RepID=A0A8K0I1V3_COCNU|nr:Universal stress protein A [Cocos nucifera]